MTPPVPIGATSVGYTVSVLFDEPLQPGALSSYNWTGRLNEVAVEASAAVAAGSQVNITMDPIGYDPGADLVTYGAIPADVLDLAGNPAAAFTDYPIS